MARGEWYRDLCVRNTDVSGAGPAETMNVSGSGGVRLRGGGHCRTKTRLKGQRQGENYRLSRTAVRRSRGGPLALAFSSRGKPSSAGSLVRIAVTVYSARAPNLDSLASRPTVSGASMSPESSHRQPSKRQHRALAAVACRRRPSLPRPSLSGLAGWARSSRVRANAPVTLVYPRDRSWNVVEVTSGQNYYKSAPNRHPVSSPPCFCVS